MNKKQAFNELVEAWLRCARFNDGVQWQALGAAIKLYALVPGFELSRYWDLVDHILLDRKQENPDKTDALIIKGKFRK